MKQSSPDCLVASCGRFCVAQSAGQRKTPWRGLQRAATVKIFRLVIDKKTNWQTHAHRKSKPELAQH